MAEDNFYVTLTVKGDAKRMKIFNDAIKNSITDDNTKKSDDDEEESNEHEVIYSNTVELGCNLIENLTNLCVMSKDDIFRFFPEEYCHAKIINKTTSSIFFEELEEIPLNVCGMLTALGYNVEYIAYDENEAVTASSKSATKDRYCVNLYQAVDSRFDCGDLKSADVAAVCWDFKNGNNFKYFPNESKLLEFLRQCKLNVKNLDEALEYHWVTPVVFRAFENELADWKKFLHDKFIEDTNDSLIETFTHMSLKKKLALMQLKMPKMFII